MAALTTDTPIVRAIGDQQTIPASATKIYSGSIIGIQSDGTGRSFVMGDRFGGHLLEGVDNSLGAAGDKQLVTNRGKYALLTTLSASAANVAARAPVYAQDGGTLSLTYGQQVGHVVNRNVDGYAIVEFDTEDATFAIKAELVRADFTDGLADAGHLDVSPSIPAGVLVEGWVITTSAGFTGDKSAVVEVGKSGDTDFLSKTVDGSVFAAATVASEADVYLSAATTARVTVTSDADFTSVSAGTGTITIFGKRV